MMTRYTRPKRSKKPLVILVFITAIITLPVLLYLNIITLGSHTPQTQQIIIQPNITQQLAVNITTVTATQDTIKKTKQLVPQETLAPLDEAMYGNN